MHALRWTLLFALAGCWIGSDEVATKIRDLPDVDTDTDTDTDVDLGPLELRGLAPEFGVNSGGTVVTIDVGTLDVEDVEVSFGGVPATTRSVEAQQVVVEAPQVGLEGAVDVVVRSAGRTERASGGFYYWADGADLAGLVGTVENYDFDRPYLEGEGKQHRAALYYIDPVEFEWWHLFASGLDKCELDFVRQGPSLDLLEPGVESITLDNGVAKLMLGPDEDGEAYGMNTQPGWVAPGRTFTLSQGPGAAGWPAFEVKDAIPMPREGFRLTSPAFDEDFGFVNRGFELRWTGGQPGDVVLVRMRRYELSSVVDEVTCALRDDGSHFVDSSVFSGWFWSSPFDVLIGRVVSEDARLPFNGAEVRAVGVHWWYGEGYQN